MNIPFTVEEFLRVFATYNNALWPLQVFLNALALASLALAFRKKPYSSSLISYILAFLWLWTGIVYHVLFFTSINPAAYGFGAAAILQGILFLWIGIKNRVSFQAVFDLKGSVAAIFIFYGLIGYPLLGAALGHFYPQSPTFGAPCPTTIFTFGMLLWTGTTLPRFVLIIPSLWSAVGFTAALNFGIKEDFGLLIAGIVATTLLSLRTHHNTKPSTL